MLAARLCLIWGIADFVAWRDSLDGTRILDQWEAFDLLEPIGLPALDQIAACAVARIQSCWSKEPAHPDDCHAFPDYSKLIRPDLSDEDLKARAIAEQQKFA